MISWIQNTLERKGRVIFILLLAVVIVSFVFVIGETPGCVSGEPGGVAQKYYGYSLNAEADPRSREVVLEVIISSIVNRGQQPQSEQMLTQEFLSRVALLHLADLAKIPEPNQDAFVEYLSTIPFFQDSSGAFDPDRVTGFLDMMQLNREFSEATINRTLSNDYRIQQLMTSISPPGFTIPFEVEEQARRSAATYSLRIARLDKEKIDFSLEPTEDELEAFFTQRVEAYRIPETRILTMASFSPEGFRPQVGTPTEQQLAEYFEENQMDYLDESAEDPAAALPQLETVREEVEADWAEEQAAIMARRASEEFVYTLFDENISLDSPEFQGLTERYPVELKELPPMVGSVPPPEIKLPQAAVSEAIRLDGIRYYSDPIETEDGVSVLLLREVIASRIPEMESVRDQVVADYTAQAEQEALVARGEEIRKEISELIAGGASFSEAAESLGLAVETHEDVSWENPPEGLGASAIRRAETLADGSVSPMVVTDEGGNFLYVKERSAPQFAVDAEEYQRTKQMLSRGNSQLFLSSFVGDLIQAGTAEMD